MSTDPDDPQILSPATLLTQKADSEVVYLGLSDVKDMYKAQWCRVQALADTFWKWSSSQYLASLQVRRKWTRPQRNVEEGDIVLLKDRDVHQNNWPVGLITKATSSSDSQVHKVDVWVWHDGKRHVYSCPISEVTVLLENNKECTSFITLNILTLWSCTNVSLYMVLL